MERDLIDEMMSGEPNAENVVSPSLGACRIYIDVEMAGHIGKQNC